MISLRFVAGGDILSRLVGRGEYGYATTHVEFIARDGTLIGAHCPDGVAIMSPGYDAAWAIAERRAHLPAAESQIAALDAFLFAQIGKPYDMAAIAAIAASFALGACHWQRADAWTCSELVAAGLIEAGIIAPLAETVAHVTPRDVMILVSARFDTVWTS